jgi:uncharacterized protein YoxC
MIKKLYFLLIYFICFNVSAGIPIANLIDGISILAHGIPQLTNDLNKPDGVMANVNNLSNSVNQIQNYVTNIPTTITNQLNNSKDQLNGILTNTQNNFNSLFTNIATSATQKAMQITGTINALKNNLVSELSKELDDQIASFINTFSQNLIGYLVGEKNIQTDLQTAIQSEINIATKYILDLKAQINSAIDQQFATSAAQATLFKNIVEKNINDLISQVVGVYTNLENFITKQVSDFKQYINNFNNTANSLLSSVPPVLNSLIELCTGVEQILDGVNHFPLIPGVPSTIIPSALSDALDKTQDILNSLKNILKNLEQNIGTPTISGVAVGVASYVANLITNIVTGIYNKPLQGAIVAAQIVTTAANISTAKNSPEGLDASIAKLQAKGDDLSSDASDIDISGIISDLQEILVAASNMLDNGVIPMLNSSIDSIDSFKINLNIDFVPPFIHDILTELKKILNNLSGILGIVISDAGEIGVDVGITIAIDLLLAGLTGVILLKAAGAIYSGAKELYKQYDYKQYTKELDKDLEALGVPEELRNTMIEKAPMEVVYKALKNEYQKALDSGNPADMKAAIDRTANAFQVKPKELFASLKDGLPENVDVSGLEAMYAQGPAELPAAITYGEPIVKPVIPTEDQGFSVEELSGQPSQELDPEGTIIEPYGGDLAPVDADKGDTSGEGSGTGGEYEVDYGGVSEMLG